MKYPLLWLGLLLIFPLSVIGQMPYKIGAILALSGDFSIHGQTCQRAINFALSDMEPSLRSQIQVVFEDDQLQGTKAVAAFYKLREVDKVNAAIMFASGSSNAVAPLAESAKFPVLAIATDPKVVKGRHYIFTLWVTPTEEARVLVKEVVRRGYKNIAQITGIQDGMLAVRREIDSQNNGAFKILISEEYPVEARDFHPFLTKLRNYKDLDAINIMLMPGQIGIFAKQARQLGISLPLFNVETFEDPNDLKLSEGALVGGWYAQADDPEGDFLKRFGEKYPRSSIYSAANCYDAVSLIADSVKRKEPLQDYLSHLKDYKGALGTFSSTGDQRFSLPAAIKVVTATGFEKQKLVADGK